MLTRSCVLLAFVLSGCAHQGVFDRNAKGLDLLFAVPSEPIPVAGAVLTIPNASKWTMTGRNAGSINAIWLVSRVPLYSRVVLVDMGTVANDFVDVDDFYRVAESHVTSVLRQAPKGVELIEKSRKTIATADCLFWRAKVPTADPDHRPNTKLVLDRMEYSCRHPTRPRTVVVFQYSERFELGQDVGDIASRAGEVFRSISFTQ